MKIQQVLVIGIQPELRELLQEAAGLAAPGAEFTALDSFAQAQARPAGERAVLVLMEPAPSLVAGARTGLDGAGLPRWALVVLGGDQPEQGVEWVEAADLNLRVIVRALRSAVEKHALARENARLRGDLMTIARRVNHDLRSSLSGVMTATEVISEVLSEARPEEAELVQPVSDSAAEIARLIDQLSFLIRATVVPVTPQKQPMNELMWRGIARVEHRIHARHAHVAHGEEWPVVVGVGAWIEMIWANLIGNALEHGGTNPQINLRWAEHGDEYRFFVEDRGPGVPVEKRSVLFSFFNQLSEPGAIRGFGHSVVQRLVELQGGRCGYEPREGGGACFYFTLPKA